MSAFIRQAAPPIPVRIGGQEYLFSPLRYADHAESAERLRSHWPSPRKVLRALAPGLSAELQRHLIEMAYREERREVGVELDDVFRWYATPAGALFRKWLMLRRCHGELSLADVDELLTLASSEELASLGTAADRADAVPQANPTSPPRQAEEQGTDRGTASSPGSSPREDCDAVKSQS